MSDAAMQDPIAAAMGYEELLVPALFGQWAATVLEAAGVEPGQCVLDVACGTGVLAREALARVGPSGAVTGIDPDPGMLALAQRLAPSVRWQVAKAEALPFEDGAFDAVLSQFGLMFFTDRSRSLSEMLRVLGPDGRLAVAVWDSLERIPAYATEVELLEQIGGAAAADALRAPFVLGDPQELAKLFESAGATATAIATHSGKARFPSIRAMLEADLRGWLPLMGVMLTEAQNQRILAEAECALRSHVGADGTVAFDVSAHIVTAAKPH